MSTYLKAAFLAGPEVAGFGRLPVNAITTALFGILGFVLPPLWLVGLGVELTVLSGLMASRRFREAADAARLRSAEDQASFQRSALARTLPDDLRRRYERLAQISIQVLELSRHGVDCSTETNREALSRLQNVYLNLLAALHHLGSIRPAEPAAVLAAHVAGLEAGLCGQDASEALRQSKVATLAIQQSRLSNLQRRNESMSEIESELTRIEAQVQLLLENVAIESMPATISAHIDLAGGSLYGHSNQARRLVRE